MNNRVLGGALAVFLAIPAAHADYLFYSSAADACEQISGHWIGSGKAESWLADCAYHGQGYASAVDAAGNFSIDVSADKDSGSFICPSHTERKLMGNCANGVVTFRSDYGNITGVYANNSGTAVGTLTASPGIDVDVSIQFTRTE